MDQLDYDGNKKYPLTDIFILPKLIIESYAMTNNVMSDLSFNIVNRNRNKRYKQQVNVLWPQAAGQFKHLFDSTRFHLTKDEKNNPYNDTKEIKILLEKPVGTYPVMELVNGWEKYQGMLIKYKIIKLVDVQPNAYERMIR